MTLVAKALHCKKVVATMNGGTDLKFGLFTGIILTFFCIQIEGKKELHLPVKKA